MREGGADGTREREVSKPEGRLSQSPDRTRPDGLPPAMAATIDIAPEASSLPTPRGFKVRLDQVGSSAAISTAEVRTILQQRLLLITLFLVMMLLFSVVAGLLFDREKFASLTSLFTLPPLHGIALCHLVFEIGILVVLVRWRSAPLSRLRWLEWCVFAPGVITTCYNERLFLMNHLSEIREGLNRGTYAGSAASGFVTTIIVYGVFIPNTWRRCAAATALIASLIVVVQAWVLLTGDVPLQHVGFYMSQLISDLVVASLIVTYGAYRLETLRQEAADARQLGQYLLGRRLGAGGMGEVYLAEHKLLRRPSALKLIRPNQAGNPGTIARFEREVQATAALAHPHVVRIHDFGRAEDDTFYCVMEYLPGITLDTLVKQYGPLPPDRVVFILRQLCSALGEAHAAGLTHRDVKPGNVIVRDSGRQADFGTLLDFGLVLDRAAGNDKLTQEGTFVGTPSYMAPEQVTGDPVDDRTDLYAVGAVGYFLLTGRPPFSAGSTMRTIAALLAESAPPIGRIDVPENLELVLRRCLSKDPKSRLESADALDADLAGCGCNNWSHSRAAAWWAARPEPLSVMNSKAGTP